MYYVYMLRCGDGSIYTGITTDLHRRFQEHLLGKGAKYTKSHGAVKIEAAWSCNDRSLASRMEAVIKRLPKREKESLANEPSKFYLILKDKLNCNLYNPVV